MTKYPAYQSGIVAPASSDALFVTLQRKQFDVLTNRADLLQSIAKIPSVLADCTERFVDAQLHLTVGLSSQFWDFLELPEKPAGLQPFQAISNKKVRMPATDTDLLLHIRSHRHDVNYHIAQAVYQLLSPFFVLDELVRGFRYLDSRDLTGFVDGTENPEGESREKVALVGDDPAFNGGSYIHLQKYLHNLPVWNSYTLKEQEDSYGRTKDENVEYSSADKSASAHTKRSSIKDADGNSIEILRHSLPFGELDQSGLMFASYSAKSTHFDLMLQSMCEVNEKDETDHILRVTNAVTGQAFFAPNIAWFKALLKE
ncbi:Dyp-type peroxidase [Gammaproteobacteria bacterium AS21]